MAAAAGQRRRAAETLRVEELPEDGIRIVEGVLRHFPVRRIDFDKRARRAKVEISLCGESKTITLSTEGGEDESS